MATVDLTSGAGSQPLMGGQNPCYLMENVVDFQKTNRSAADVLQLLSIPAKTLVKNLVIDVVTAEGGTLTVDIGDGADIDGYVDGANGNAVADALAAAAGFSGEKYYSAADTIDMTVNDAADAAKIYVRALCISFAGAGL